MGHNNKVGPLRAGPRTAGSSALAADEQQALAAAASTAYRTRGVPSDWFIDPADPDAAERFESAGKTSLDDAATAFLAAHEALENGEALLDLPTQAPGEMLVPAQQPLSQPVWIGLPLGTESFDDEGDLGWQSDALCAQTDPEAFFPEKGGSTRDAKKVCGSCNVRSQCLEYALANDERFGIWGGLSERERRRLRKRAI